MVNSRSMNSYTSADVLPMKLFCHPNISNFVPIHVQWLPTNACNLNCPSCSCGKRNKSLQMSTVTSIGVICSLSKRGCKAVTITGGGEPLMHPGIEDMIDAFDFYGIKVGLVTNGINLDKISMQALDKVTWCRISSMDWRKFDSEYAEMLSDAVRADVDWAFSHVVTDKPNLETIERLVRFANQHKFTHVRLVANLLETDKVDSNFVEIRKRLNSMDSNVIYQARSNPKPCTSCLIGYIKPLIGPDFKIYLCCGVQYALKERSLDLPEELSMGSALDLDEAYKNHNPKTTKCIACYYTQYNDILRVLNNGLEHKEFV